MEDKKLYYVCLIFSVLSIVSLLIFSYLREPVKVSVSSIDKGFIGRNVRISGKIKKGYLSEDGHFFFHVKDGNKEINAVIFSEGLEDMELDPLKLEDGRKIEIGGEVGLYNKELQIIPDKVIL